MTREKLIERLDASFIKIAFEDIKRALDENTTLAVFILGTCLVDALAGFCYGKEKIYDHKDAYRFKKFVERYKKILTPFTPDNLWQLRCGLTHSFSNNKFSFTNKKSQLHNKLHIRGRLNINDTEFYGALKKVYSQFKQDISTDDKIFKLALKRYNAPSLQLIRIQDPKS